jgi:hypothetical protein
MIARSSDPLLNIVTSFEIIIQKKKLYYKFSADKYDKLIK